MLFVIVLKILKIDLIFVLNGVIIVFIVSMISSSCSIVDNSMLIWFMVLLLMLKLLFVDCLSWLVFDSIVWYVLLVNVIIRYNVVLMIVV